MDSSNIHDLHQQLLLLNWNFPNHLLNGNDTNLSNTGNELSMVEDIRLQQMSLFHELSSYSSGGFDPLSFGIFLPSIRSSFMQPLQTSDQFGRSVVTPCHAPNYIHGSPYFDGGGIDYGIRHHLQGVGGRCDLTLREMPHSDPSGVTGDKSSSSCSSSMDQVKAAKRPRFESRPALSPFKVRKEKLGDRIAALQQLVAPFGKTDTASVLTEAVGYIKFLQDQVETLSGAYMGPSNIKKLRTKEEVSANETEDTKPDLRTRGLCLVPLSCTSYVTGDNVVWSPPNYM